MFTEFSLPGSRPYFSPNPFYEKLKIKERDVISFVHNLETEKVETSENFQELRKENNFYR